MSFNETMKALSAPERREILNLLKSGSMTAGEIGEHFDMTGATMSYHLSTLKKAGLITESKNKNFIIYSLNASVLEELMLWIEGFKKIDSTENIDNSIVEKETEMQVKEQPENQDEEQD